MPAVESGLTVAGRSGPIVLVTDSCWEQLKAFDVPGTENREVAAVECCQLRLVESLDDRQNRRVDEADVRVGVPVAQLGNPTIVGRVGVDDLICAIVDVREQGHEHSRVQASVDQVVDLDQHRSRDQEGLSRFLDQLPASSVVVVAAIERRVERACVQD